MKQQRVHETWTPSTSAGAHAPGDEIRTAAASINDHGDIAGFVIEPDGVSGHGYTRDRQGRYPDAAPGTTAAWSINDHGTVSGNYIDPDGIANCFFRDRKGRYTTFDHPDADTTPTPLGTGTGYCVINNQGDIAGAFGANGTVHAFTRTHQGRYRVIDRPGAVITVPSQINNRGQVAGTYGVGATIDDPNGVNHGFLRDQRGRRDRVATIDHPQAAANGTTTYGLTDRGDTVGSYSSLVDGKPALGQPTTPTAPLDLGPTGPTSQHVPYSAPAPRNTRQLTDATSLRS